MKAGFSTLLFPLALVPLLSCQTRRQVSVLDAFTGRPVTSARITPIFRSINGTRLRFPPTDWPGSKPMEGLSQSAWRLQATGKPGKACLYPLRCG